MTNGTILERRPENLAAYVEAIQEFQARSKGPIWYRGCSTSERELLPSLYRPRENPNVAPAGLSELEQRLVTRFLDRSLPYHNRELQPDLKTLFFMQHYSLPTRLLDWTENPFVGLFFALRTAKYHKNSKGRVVFQRNPVVWVLDPSLWNQAALQHLTYTGGPLDSAHEFLEPYLKIGDIKNLGKIPVALYGAHNSPRIVAQQGTFVIFGSSTTPMEDLYRKGQFPNTSLARVTIPRGAVAALRESLFKQGFTDGSMFPDLEGLGRDLRRWLGFDI